MHFVFLVTRETIIADLTAVARQNIARDLKCPIEMVRFTWEPRDGGVVPNVDVEMPAPLPPTEIDPLDPKHKQAMEEWEAQVGELPGVRAWLAAKGVDKPDDFISRNIRAMIVEMHRRMEVLRAYEAKKAKTEPGKGPDNHSPPA
jgi:hypothetical protein